MRRWGWVVGTVLLLAGGCAADGPRHDFSGGFAGVTVAPSSNRTTARP